MLIDPKIQRLLRPLSADERAQLLASLQADGCLQPLTVYRRDDGQDVLLDGHNRYELCTEHGIEFETVEIDLEGRTPVKWVIQHQLGRRNITPREFRYWIGRLYEEEKRDPADTQYGYVRVTEPCGETASCVARRTGVSPSTVDRAAQLTRAVEALCERVGDEFYTELMANELDISDGDVKLLATLEKIKTMPAVRTWVAERAAARRPRASSPKSFSTVSVVGWTTYIDDATGDECIDTWKLGCGCEPLARRGTRLKKTHQKTRPCHECGSGTRTPHEKRRAERAFEEAFRQVWGSPDHAEQARTLIKTDMLLHTLRPMDKRARDLRVERGEALAQMGFIGGGS